MDECPFRNLIYEKEIKCSENCPIRYGCAIESSSMLNTIHNCLIVYDKIVKKHDRTKWIC